ncbi:hypothetical protein [Kitasatospora azatica]|uniref:hypothetical protein n=1 Tax=Kitasatospora azatica TaxID=58347 RepID=UPI0005616CE3|nr:hypothetical protein [Kitasatospora azatica]
MHPRLTVRRVAAGLLAAAVLAVGLPSLATAAPTPVAPAADSAPAPRLAPGPYVSPWGSAQVSWDPGFKSALDDAGITVTPIAPVTTMPGEAGLISDIGWTSDDYIDLIDFGRVYYPGGWTFSNPATGGSWTANEFWLRFFPNQGLSTYPEINGSKSPTEQRFVSYTLGSAFTGGAGWGLDLSRVAIKTAKVPLTLTPEGAAGINQALNTTFHPGDQLGTLSGTFRYLP